ncbi:MAG: 2-hydroxychromene-2-carboxylate isomerase [Marinovum sp.]|nr:2-hydroxychromene-2-carboxylate isomerase [Marinovum sp.]
MNDTARPEMEFWFEFASTYSYLSAMRIVSMAQDAGVSVAWRPFLLGPIFHAQGWETSPFSIYEAKGRNMWRDVERLTSERGLPYQKPSLFPQHTILAARMSLVALDVEGGETFVQELYRANFERGEDLSSPGTISNCLARTRLDESLLEQAVTPGNKQRLKDQTARAIEIGLFGAPSFVVDGEIFWGDDRLEQALRWARK